MRSEIPVSCVWYGSGKPVNIAAVTTTTLALRYAIAHAVLTSVRDLGGDADALARQCGFASNADSGAAPMPSLAHEIELWDVAAQAVGDPFFGIHVAQRIQRGVFGALEFLCRSAPTLGDAIDAVVKYVPIIQPDIRVSSYVADDETIVESQILCGVPRARQVNEFFCALVLLGAQLLSRTRMAPLRVWFANPEPADTSELRALFGTAAFGFGRPTSGIAVDARARKRPVVSSDPPLHAVLERVVSGELPNTSGDIVLRARRLIAATLYQRTPRIDWVARLLGVSERTLQRQLAADESSFRSLVEEVRCELACTYLTDANRSIGEIPYLLGYADARQFFRSFKRWTRMTPRQFRDLQSRARTSTATTLAADAATLAPVAIGSLRRSR